MFSCSDPRKPHFFRMRKGIESKYWRLGGEVQEIGFISPNGGVTTPSGAKASSSTPNYYMFGASKEMISSAVVTCIQCVSRSTPSPTRGFVESL